MGLACRTRVIEAKCMYFGRSEDKWFRGRVGLSGNLVCSEMNKNGCYGPNYFGSKLALVKTVMSFGLIRNAGSFFTGWEIRLWRTLINGALFIWFILWHSYRQRLDDRPNSLAKSYFKEHTAVVDLSGITPQI